LLSLFLSLLIEIPVLFLLVKNFSKEAKKISNKEIFVAGSIATILSLPYLWFILPSYINARYSPYMGEGIVVLIEAVILNQLLKLSIKESVLMSLVMNMVSFGLGLLIF